MHRKGNKAGNNLHSRKNLLCSYSVLTRISHLLLQNRSLEPTQYQLKLLQPWANPPRSCSTCFPCSMFMMLCFLVIGSWWSLESQDLPPGCREWCTNCTIPLKLTWNQQTIWQLWGFCQPRVTFLRKVYQHPKKPLCYLILIYMLSKA